MAKQFWEDEKGAVFITAMYDLWQKSKQNGPFHGNAFIPSRPARTGSADAISEGFFEEESISCRLIPSS